MKHIVCTHSLLQYFSSSSSLRKACAFVCSAIICFFLSTALVWSVPPSPAGGSYLALDGADDYAFLEFDEHGVLLKAGTTNLTIEAWVYATSPPPPDREATILAQQTVLFVSGSDGLKFGTSNPDWRKDDLILRVHAYTSGGYRTTPYLPLSLYEWHHIAFQVQDDSYMLICDDLSASVPSRMIIEPNVPKLRMHERADFVLGGYGREHEPTNPLALIWGSFEGYIDEVRISNVARYDTGDKPLLPEDRFKPDTDTIALWHFDEDSGAGIFQDSSDNEYHLVGENGATSLSVNGRGKLATAWSAVKTNGD